MAQKYAALTAAIFASFAATADAKVGVVQLLQSAGGDTVALLDMSDKAAIIRVSNTHTALDELALPYTIESVTTANDYRLTYLTRWRGREFAFLQFASKGARGTWSLFVPGKLSAAIALQPVESSLDPQTLVRENAQQLENGAIAKFSKFDRATEEAAQENQLRAATERFHTACKSKAPLQLDWPTFTDAMLRTINVATYCESSVSALAIACKDSRASLTAIGKRIKGITCAYGEAVSIQLAKDGMLRFTVEEHGHNLADYVRDFVNKAL